MNLLRVALGKPKIEVGHISHNGKAMINIMEKAIKKDVGLLVFPPMTLTGLTIGDYVKDQNLKKQVDIWLHKIIEASKNNPILTIFGAPIHEKKPYQAMIGIQNGQILFIKAKELSGLEHRSFKSADGEMPSILVDEGFGFELVFNGYIKPSTDLAIYIDTEAYTIGKRDTKAQFSMAWSKEEMGTLVYLSGGFGESTTDEVYSGDGFIAHQGRIIAAFSPFNYQEEMLVCDIDKDTWAKDKKREEGIEILLRDDCDGRFLSQIKNPFLPSKEENKRIIEDAISIQSTGLYKRVDHVKPKKLLLGVSGGLDATLALLIAYITIKKMDRSPKDIIGITMPGFGTTKRTKNNALDLMKALGIDNREIDIKDICKEEMDLIGHSGYFDVAFENIQARMRTKILMDIGNMENGLVLGTGDMSEIALGFATFGGDHLSHYNVNVGMPKTVVQETVRYMAKEKIFSEEISNILLDILATPISPELLPGTKDGEITQKTEDIVGPYLLIDFFLYNKLLFGLSYEKLYFLSRKAFEGIYDEEEIEKTLESFHSRFIRNQFKRNSLPDGPQVFPVGLSPRNALSMPSDLKIDR